MPKLPSLHRPRRIALAAMAALGLALPTQRLNALVIDGGRTLSFADGVHAGDLQLLNGTLLIPHDTDLTLSGNHLVNGVVTLGSTGTPFAVLRFTGDTHMTDSGQVTFQGWADAGPGSLMVTNDGRWTQDANTLLQVGHAVEFSNLSGGIWELSGSSYANSTQTFGTDPQSMRFSNQAGALLLKTGDGQAGLSGNLYNFGTVRAEQGQLVLYGVDLHSDALLQGQGGEVVLNGQHSFQGQNLLQGSVSIFDASNATVMAGGLLRVGDGVLSNRGTLSVVGELRVDAGASLANAGALRYGTDFLGNNGLINVQGSLSNAGLLDADRLQLDGLLTNTGSMTANLVNGAGLLDNRGSFELSLNGVAGLAGFANSGQASLDIGSALTVNNSFVNAAGGQLFLTNASLTLAAGVSGSNAGTLTVNSASVLVLNGSLANAGTLTASSTDGGANQLQLNAGGQLHNLAGGSINAGALQVYAGARVVNDAGASLVVSQVSVDPGAAVVSEGAIQLDQQWIHLGSLALSGNAVFTSAGQFINSGSVALSRSASFVNQGGVFDMSALGASLTIGSGASFFNNGVMTLMNGTSLAIDAGGTFSNTYGGGPLALQGSIRLDGSLSNQAGAYVVLQGNVQGQGGIDNAGRLLVGAGGVVAVNQLRNTGVVLVMDGGANPQAAGVLEAGQVLNVNGAELNVEGRLSFAGSRALTNEAAARISVAGRIEADHSAVVANAGRLELLTAASWSGGGQLTNTGTLIVGTGASMAVDRLDSQAGTLTVDGSVDTSAGVTLTLSGGVLNGNGLINGDVFVGGGAGIASFRPGHSPGHFTINGALAVGANGELELQVQRLADGSLAWDRVSAASVSFLDGATVRFEIGSGVATSRPQTLGFLDCGSGCNFAAGVHWVVDGAPAGTTLAFTSSGLQLNVSAVPEPATVLLWLVGLAALAGFRARRSSDGYAE